MCKQQSMVPSVGNQIHQVEKSTCFDSEHSGGSSSTVDTQHTTPAQKSMSTRGFLDKSGRFILFDRNTIPFFKIYHNLELRVI